MVTIDKIQQGIAKFIDRELVPSLSGWDKVLVGGAAGLMAANLPRIIGRFSSHPVVAALGVYDAENNMIDIDAVYSAVQPYIGTERLPAKIPLLGITVKMGKQEIETLYRYIKEM